MLRLPTRQRAMHVALVAAAHAMAVVYFIRAFQGPWSWWELALGILAGHLLIDLITIVVHWTVDNYFEPTSPVIGSTVYYFREHHHKAYEMFQRDYVEGNFRNAALSVLGQAVLLLVVSGCAANAAVGFAGLMGAYITQIHKWAHMKHPPAPVRAAQKTRLLVGWHFHNTHHARPQLHYGLYAGWFDGLFDRLRVFETAERVIASLTGQRAVESRLVAETPGADREAALR